MWLVIRLVIYFLYLCYKEHHIIHQCKRNNLFTNCSWYQSQIRSFSPLFYNIIKHISTSFPLTLIRSFFLISLKLSSTSSIYECYFQFFKKKHYLTFSSSFSMDQAPESYISVNQPVLSVSCTWSNHLSFFFS